MAAVSEHDSERRKSTSIIEHALTRKATTRSLRTSWQVPPMPPVPGLQDMSWQRRSMKRDSYTSSTFKIPRVDDAPPSIYTSGPNSAWNTTFRPQTTYFPVLQALRSREQRQQSSRASWDDHPANPHRWAPHIRWLHAIGPLVSTFTITLASSINAPIWSSSTDDFGLASTTAVLPHCLYLLGLSCAVIMGYSREMLARKTILLTSMAAFVIFNIIAAFIRHPAALITTRLLAGIAASTQLPTAVAMLLDLFPAGKRTAIFVCFGSIAALGTILGSVLGSILVQSVPQWAEYSLLICAAVSLFSIVIMRETSHTRIAQRHGIDIHDPARRKLSSYWRRLEELVRQRSIYLAAITFGAISATTFSLIQALSSTLQGTYSLGSSLQGSMILALLCGSCLSTFGLALHHTYAYLPRRAQWEQNFVIEWDKYERRRRRLTARGRIASYTEAWMSRASIPVSVSHEEIKLPNSAAVTRGHSRGFCMSPGLAVAIASEIDARPSTVGHYVSAEQVWAISVQKASFADVLDELESQYCVNLDRIKMIRLYESWSGDGARTSVILTTATTLQLPQPPSDLNSSKFERLNHRALAMAALEGGGPESTTASSSLLAKRRSLYFNAPLLARQRPPPKWRLLPALLGAPLSTTGLFVLAWTTHTHWIVPAIGLALYACGAFTAAVCICLFLVDTYGSADITHSLTILCSVTYMAAFASSMLTVPLFARVAPEWALSVLAFGSLLIWIAPLCLQYLDVNEEYYDRDE